MRGARCFVVTILMVDDDPDVLELTAELLAEHGYRVLKASQGRDALALVERDADIRLLVTDIVMPGMNGLELAAHAMQQRPDLRVLYVSGYAANWDDRVPPGKLLAKPWRPVDLVREIEAALSA